VFFALLDLDRQRRLPAPSVLTPKANYLRAEVNRLKLEGMPEAPRLRAVDAGSVPGVRHSKNAEGAGAARGNPRPRRPGDAGWRTFQALVLFWGSERSVSVASGSAASGPLASVTAKTRGS